MRTELAAGRQHCEHGAVDGRNRVQQLDGSRAQRTCRRKKVIVPLEIKALPAALEERIEAPVVVLRGCPDKTLVEESHRFVANRLTGWCGPTVDPCRHR